MMKRRMREKRRRSRGDPKTKQKIEHRVISWTAFKILYPGPYMGRLLAVSDSKIELMIIRRVSYVASYHYAGIFWCASSPLSILSLNYIVNYIASS